MFGHPKRRYFYSLRNVTRLVEPFSLKRAVYPLCCLAKAQPSTDSIRFLFVAHSLHQRPILPYSVAHCFSLKGAFTPSLFKPPPSHDSSRYRSVCTFSYIFHHDRKATQAKAYSSVYTRNTRKAAFSTECQQSQMKIEVREKSLSCFKEEWVRILRDQDVSEPFWSVKWIVQYALGGHHRHGNHEDRYPDFELSASQLKLANEMLNKRIQRVPVQYIIGEWDFRNVTLTMQPPVFIPEPETEVLVELVLEHCGLMQEKNTTPTTQTKATPTFLDLCCGSGAIAVSLLHGNRELRGYAVDQSEEAVALTRENAERNHVSDRLSVHRYKIDQCVSLFRDHLGVEFDFIVSNPPYIPSAHIPHLQREITEYYDWKALDGGEEGSKYTCEILSLCRHILRPKGELWLETDPGGVNTLRGLLLSNPEWEMMYKSNHSDHHGRTRFHQLTRI